MSITIGGTDVPGGGFVDDEYRFRTVTYVSNPQIGTINLNNGNPELATYIIIHYISSSGFNMEPFIQDISSGDTITLIESATGNRNYIFDATGDPELETNFARIPVSSVRIENLFSNNTKIRVFFGVGTADSLVDSVFGRTGDVVAEVSDYDANQIDYDNATSGLVSIEVQSAIDEIDSTVDTLVASSHDPVTLHSGDPTQESANLVGQELELNQATDSSDGVMSSEDKELIESPFRGGTLTTKYLFDSSTTKSNPGSGNFRINNGNEFLATELFIHPTPSGSGGSDIIEMFDTDLKVGDILRFTEVGNRNIYGEYEVTGSVVDEGLGAWYTIPISVRDPIPSFSNGIEQEVGFCFGIFSGSEKTKLSGIETGATADQIASEVPFTPDGDISSTNAQTAIVEVRDDTDTKLSNKSDVGHTHVLADVTDAGNIAGLDMDTQSPATLRSFGGEIQVNPGGIDTAHLTNQGVTNTKLSNMAQDTIKGRITAGTGDPEDLTATQVRTIINVEDGSTGDQIASEVPFTPDGDIAATNVQSAIEEVRNDTDVKLANKANLSSLGGMAFEDFANAHDGLSGGVFYIPTTSGDWDSVPDNSGDALDELASRTETIENNIIGKQTIWIPAIEMIPAVTNGATFSTEEYGSITIRHLDFDATTAEYAHFQIAMPNRWDKGTLTYSTYQRQVGGSSGDNVFSLQGVALRNNTSIGSASFGTAVPVVVDTTSGGRVSISPESSNVTVGGSPVDDDIIFFRIYRDVSHASDTQTVDINLIGIKLYWTSDDTNDS